VRDPVVAGQFYPRDPEQLRATVNKYIDDADIEPAPGKVEAIVVPHAGYPFSGPTAGYAYARAKGKRPSRVILAGCSHRELIETASVYAEGAFASPLGEFPVDKNFAGELAERTGSRSVEAHFFEHSLEVQLPFFAVAFGIVPIVPVLFSGPPNEWHQRVGRVVSGMADAGDLLVASTDLSHYLSESEARAIDRATIEAVVSQDVPAFEQGVVSHHYSLCGSSAVAAAMGYALERNATDWRELRYTTSAEASGDPSRVVGYVAISMERANAA
jgi:hypothetical protein